MMLCTLSLVFVLACAQKQESPPPPTSAWELLEQKYDANKDARISAEEHGRGVDAFKNLDRNGDGVITAADLQMEDRKRGRADRQGKRGRQQPRIAAPKVGQQAPDFELHVLVHEKVDAKKPSAKMPSKKKAGKSQADKKKVSPTIKLSSFVNKKPVALIFGSYT